MHSNWRRAEYKESTNGTYVWIVVNIDQVLHTACVTCSINMYSCLDGIIYAVLLFSVLKARLCLRGPGSTCKERNGHRMSPTELAAQWSLVMSCGVTRRSIRNGVAYVMCTELLLCTPHGHGFLFPYFEGTVY